MALSLSFTYLNELNQPVGLTVDASGNLEFVQDLKALEQKSEQRLRFFEGEWFLNSQAGIPYFQEIFEKPVDPAIVVNLLNDDLYQESDIVAIDEVNVNLNRASRNFTYSARIESTFGTMNLNTSGTI